MKRPALALSAIVVGVVVSSCAVGVRKPASAITETSAVLRGDVLSTTGGTGSYYIEYGTAGAQTQRTPTREIDFTTNTIYPVAEPISGLTPEAAYHYSVCAEDSENPGDAFCSPDQTFVATDKDFVSGSGCWVCGLTDFNLDVRSGPSGESPDGSGHFGGPSTLISGRVSCLTVTGKRATLGITGEGGAQDGMLFVQDNGSPGSHRDYIGWRILPAPPPSCPPATDADFPHVPPQFGDAINPIESGEILVWDAPASPGASR
jgi:hypothetical protein